MKTLLINKVSKDLIAASRAGVVENFLGLTLIEEVERRMPHWKKKHGRWTRNTGEIVSIEIFWNLDNPCQLHFECNQILQALKSADEDIAFFNRCGFYPEHHGIRKLYTIQN